MHKLVLIKHPFHKVTSIKDTNWHFVSILDRWVKVIINMANYNNFTRAS